MATSNIPNFSDRMYRFVIVAQALVESLYHEGNDPGYLETEEGYRYIKVFKTKGDTRKPFCFIDKRTGDVLRPASPKQPAHGARSNIFDPDFGRSGITADGTITFY